MSGSVTSELSALSTPVVGNVGRGNCGQGELWTGGSSCIKVPAKARSKFMELGQKSKSASLTRN